MIFIVACCHGVKLCAYAARDFRSQQCHCLSKKTLNFGCISGSRSPNRSWIFKFETFLDPAPVSSEISDFTPCAYPQRNILHINYTEETDE